MKSTNNIDMFLNKNKSNLNINVEGPNNGKFLNYIFIFPFLLSMILFTQEERNVSLLSFNINFQYIVVFYTVLMIIFLLISSAKTIIIDTVTMLLIMRMGLGIISLKDYESNLLDFFYYGYFSLIFLTILYILVYKSFNVKNTKFITNTLVIISLIIIAQVLLAFFNGLSEGVSFMYIKSWINIPIGRSNFIAIFINPLIIYLLITMEKSKFKTVLLILLLVSSILTFSDGGLICLFLVFLLYKLNKIKMVLYRTIVIIFVSLILFLILIITPSLITNSVQDVSIFYSYRNTLEQIMQGDFDGASSGRIEIYYYYLNEIGNNLMFGHGFYKPFTKTIANPHNFLLSELYSSGVISLALYLTVIFTILRKLRKVKENDHIINAVYYSSIYILIHSLIEPGIFGHMVGAIFWIFLAVAYKRSKVLSY